MIPAFQARLVIEHGNVDLTCRSRRPMARFSRPWKKVERPGKEWNNMETCGDVAKTRKEFSESLKMVNFKYTCCIGGIRLSTAFLEKKRKEGGF